VKEVNRNLWMRVISAGLLFPFVVWATWAGGLIFALLCAAASALGAVELLAMLGPIGLAELYGVAVSALFPLGPWLSGGGFPSWAPVALPFAGIGLLTIHLFRTELEAVPRRASAVALAWVYVAPTLASVVSLRLRFGWGWVLLAFVLAWANDITAYFTGRFLGRHQMFPRVSPRKTWEGFAGGVVGSVAGALAVLALDPAGDLRLGPRDAVVLGAVAAVLGPVGDLAESMLKRAAGVKDSGKLLPGHGGLLDRIDALMFVAPWAWIFAAYLR
jgi:phosphatidate cytidylyltransferase